MRRGVRATRVALVLVVSLILGADMVAAQVDLAKALVGTWQGERQHRTKKGGDASLTLVISSVKQVDGKWIADGRSGGTEAKTVPVQIEIDTSGSRPSLRWTGGSGIAYDLSLLDDKNLAGTAVLTTGQGGGKGSRDRSVKLEKQN